MADIFISYSRHDQRRIEPVVRLLEQEGFSVWWDAELLPGERFGDVIRRALDDVGCVIVAWSSQSAESSWVCDEASIGLRRKRLVQISLDGTPPPLGFGQVQGLDLHDWTGNADDPRIRKLVAGVRRVIGGSDQAPPPAATRGQPERPAAAPVAAARAPTPAVPGRQRTDRAGEARGGGWWPAVAGAVSVGVAALGWIAYPALLPTMAPAVHHASVPQPSAQTALPASPSAPTTSLRSFAAPSSADREPQPSSAAAAEPVRDRTAEQKRLVTALSEPMPPGLEALYGSPTRNMRDGGRPELAAAILHLRAAPSGGLPDWGSVRWSFAGYPLAPETIIRAEAEVPAQRLKMSLVVRRDQPNGTAAMEVTFTLPASSRLGGIAELPAVMMSDADTGPDDELHGVIRRSGDNSFSFSFAVSDADQHRNATLLRDRRWLKFVLASKSGQHAILALEKGELGKLAFGHAVAHWEQ